MLKGGVRVRHMFVFSYAMMCYGAVKGTLTGTRRTGRASGMCVHAGARARVRVYVQLCYGAEGVKMYRRGNSHGCRMDRGREDGGWENAVPHHGPATWWTFVHGARIHLTSNKTRVEGERRREET
ncbi:hypothetical protein DM02DRAFT_90567 [Periconia macrospinosa]|uniref:Uncharacterized protein n=1 Tax=Periconia macrospinosa TaxID=97972 RepID=A0A2V1DGR5_9PLEO|nr:hypothetical protein DM02DRAFT_90567 [Periconia macrospinosa]